jgi:hypothetical protein
LEIEPCHCGSNQVVATRFEEECPGYEPLPDSLPMLNPSTTFPLLRIYGSQWLQNHDAVRPRAAHFAIISSDHLLQVIALPDVECSWDAES